jgi:hypothetical protein
VLVCFNANGVEIDVRGVLCGYKGLRQGSWVQVHARGVGGVNNEVIRMMMIIIMIIMKMINNEVNNNKDNDEEVSSARRGLAITIRRSRIQLLG